MAADDLMPAQTARKFRERSGTRALPAGLFFGRRVRKNIGALTVRAASNLGLARPHKIAAEKQPLDKEINW
jgi:hypothetical protein